MSEPGIREAIILAGGLGRRLRDTVPGLPKCMAPVHGRPFIGYVVDYFKTQGIGHFIFSLGYRHEVIVQYLLSQYPDLQMSFAIEPEPLGTGGAVLLATEKATHTQVLVMNGDTLFRIKTASLISRHFDSGAQCTLCLKPMTNFDRYGAVELNEQGMVIRFSEKKFYVSGFINGGVYALNVEQFRKMNFPAKFSFETDYLERANPGELYGCVLDEYFIDIGIPADYARANEEFQKLLT